MENNQNATTNDFLIPDTIEETISQIKWMPNPSNQILASCGWDSRLKVWQLAYQPNSDTTKPTKFQSNLVFNSQLSDPLLSLCWQPDSTNLFTGSGDGSLNWTDMNQGKSMILGKHEIGCKDIAWVPNLNVLLSGGWDRKLMFWDLKTNRIVFSLDTGRKIYSLSLTYPLLVVAMEDRVVSYYNLNKLNKSGNFGPEATFESPLKYQTRKVATFPDGNGYAIGSVEGRVAIKYADLNKPVEIKSDTKTTYNKDDFSFRCHRTGAGGNEVYPINDIAFNSVYGTFCTAGGDGSWTIWDKDSKSKLANGFLTDKAPITAIDYSANGDLLAYASGYDWAKGVSYEGSISTKINIHLCLDSEKKKKIKK